MNSLADTSDGWAGGLKASPTSRPRAPTLEPASAAALGPIVGFLTGGAGDASTVPWRSLRPQDLRVVRAWLKEAYDSGERERCLLALGTATDGLGTVRHRLPEVSRRRLSLLRTGRRLTRRESTALFDVLGRDERSAGRRDAAVMALLA